jgi:phage terminase large subunit-like protein
MSTIRKDKEALDRYQKLCTLIANSTTVNPFEKEFDKQERLKSYKSELHGFKKFVEYYFPHYAEHETPDFHIRIARRVRRQKRIRVWLKWARGHAKSVVALVLLPLWLWINGDINFLVVIGQNEDKACILLGDLQAEFETNQRLIADYGPQMTSGKWEEGFFVTKSGFIAKAMGMGQDPRGLRVGATRPDFIVCDDWETKETQKNPKRQDEYANWLLRSVLPAMDNKNRRCLICQNHFAPRMIFSKIVEENNSWEEDRVNAYDPVTYEPAWPSKYTAEFWKEIEGEVGTLAAQSEYNNEPHVEGKLFTDDMIQWGPIPSLKSMDYICGKWDVAWSDKKTADFNAVRIWGTKNGKKYLIDCLVKQCRVKQAIRWMADFQKRLPDGVHVQIGFEAQFWNEEILRNIEEVEAENKIRLNLVKDERRTGKKYDHIITMLPQYQNSRVIYNKALKSHNDTQVGLAQLKGIEPGYNTKDDAPDADVNAFDELDQFSKISKGSSKVGPARETRKF